MSAPENDDLLDRLQSDVYSILRATPSLALARVINDNKGDLESELETSLATLNDETGKSGLAIIVLAPEVDDATSNLPGPPLEVIVNVQCIELAELNRSETDGTLIRSSTAATRVLSALHHACLGSHVLYPIPKRPLKPLPMRTGFVAYLVSMRTLLNGLNTGRTGMVTAVWNEDEQSLGFTCETPGAAIYYTTDGSYKERWTLDEPITKEEMIDAAIDALPEIWEGADNKCAARMSVEWPKNEDLNADEFCMHSVIGGLTAQVQVRKTRFKNVVSVEHVGDMFKWWWDIYFFPADGSAPVMVEEDVYEEWFGPGSGPQDDPSWEMPWHIIEPPTEPGEKRRVNLRFECYVSPYGQLPQIDGEGT